MELKLNQDTIPAVKRDHLMSQIRAKVIHLPYDKDGTLYLTFTEYT